MRAGRVLSLILAGVAVLAVVVGGLAAIEEAGDPHCVTGDGRIFTQVHGGLFDEHYDVRRTGGAMACQLPGLRGTDIPGYAWTVAGLPADITGGTDAAEGYVLPSEYRWSEGYRFMQSFVSRISQAILVFYGLLAVLCVAGLCGLEWRRG